jgi:hypothetical protein
MQNLEKSLKRPFLLYYIFVVYYRSPRLICKKATMDLGPGTWMDEMQVFVSLKSAIEVSS